MVPAKQIGEPSPFSEFDLSRPVIIEGFMSYQEQDAPYQFLIRLCITREIYVTNVINYCLLLCRNFTQLWLSYIQTQFKKFKDGEDLFFNEISPIDFS
ncbi:hypothetical protein ACHQM5_013880 [Ranunculus cassubicifolius]